MKTSKLKKAIVTLATCCSMIAVGQIAPVSSRTMFRPPYSAQVSEWAEKITLTLLLRDLSVTNGRVFLRMHLESADVSVQTSMAFFPKAIQLEGGVPIQIDGSELRDLFKVENLVFSGISATEFVRNGSRLPEGIYRLWFEVFEWGSQLKVSAAEGFATISLFDIEPPILNFPENNSMVIAEIPQNLMFSWTPRHLHASSSGFRGIYDFELVKIPEHYDGDLAILFTTTQKELEQTLFPAQFLYNEFSGALIPNFRYAFRVRVRDVDETNTSFQLKNNGYSEIFTFRYAEKCEKPEQLQAFAEDSYSAKIEWDKGNLQNRSLVLYRKAGNEEYTWFTSKTDSSSLLLNDLSPNQTYEIRVKTLCEFTTSEESESVFVTTPAISDSGVDCGVSFVSPDSCVKPLTALSSQEVFTSNGTTIHLREISGSNGIFSGKGYITMPNFQFVKVNVTFENIRINECFQHTNGIVSVVYDEENNLFFDGDTYFEGGDFDFDKEVGDDCEAENTVDFPIDTNLVEILDNGNIVLGNGTDTQTISAKDLPTTIIDSEGDIYEITPDGEVNLLAQTSSETSSFPKDTAQTHGKVVFSKHSEQTEAFDEYQEVYQNSVLLRKHYEKWNEDFIPYQLLEAKKSGKVRANFIAKTDSLNPQKIIFKNGKNTVFQAQQVDESSFDVSLVGADDGELQVISAVYIKDSTELILGKLFAPSFKKILHKIKIIPIFAKPFDLENLKNELKTIFEPYLVDFNLTADSVFSDTAWDLNGNGVLDVVGSGFGATLTEEMREINRRYRIQREVDRETIYLFLLEKGPKNTDGISIAGDMPRGEQMGYLFLESSETLAKTAAHEICHGLFKLKHTFDNDYQIPRESTTNLMDYGKGTDLAYWQWLQLQSPPTVWTAFESDSDGAMIMISDEKVREIVQTVKTAKNQEKTLSFKNEQAYIAYDWNIEGFHFPRIFVRIYDAWNLPIKIKVRKIDTLKQQNDLGKMQYLTQVYTDYSAGTRPYLAITVYSREEQKNLYAYLQNLTTGKPLHGNPLMNMRIVHTNTAPNSGGMFGCVRTGEDNCGRISKDLPHLPKYDDKKKVHDGIDLYASVETSVYSMYDGEVVFIETRVAPNTEGGYGALGNRVVIKYTAQQHGNKGNGKTVYVSYAHLNSVNGNIKAGSKIFVGQVIGKSGCTGNAKYLYHTDTWRQHLHLTVYEGSWANHNRVDPRKYITTKFDNHGNKMD